MRTGYEIGRDEQGFTARQREVMRFTEEGLNGNQIAQKLGIDRRRVSQIKGDIKKRLAELEAEKPGDGPAAA